MRPIDHEDSLAILPENNRGNDIPVRKRLDEPRNLLRSSVSCLSLEIGLSQPTVDQAGLEIADFQAVNVRSTISRGG
jgi:hypothetical protein